MISPTREQIYVALWNLFVNHATVKARVVTSSRYLKHFTDVDGSTQMPALFITQVGEGWVKGDRARGLPAKRTLKAHLWYYVYTGQPDSILPATLINELMDVVDEVIEHPGNPSNVQTLGGLVEHVFISGEIEMAEGLEQDKSLVLVPIEILIP